MKLFRMNLKKRDYSLKIGELIDKDIYLSYIYTVVYKTICDNLIPDLGVLEIGAVDFSLKKFNNNSVVSNIYHTRNIDLVLDAESVPFKDSVFGNIVLKDTFHHLKDINLFMKNVDRLLMKNGKLILIEPYWGLPLRIIDFFFHPEPFNFKSKHWGSLGGEINMGNQALVYNVFKRDLNIFQAKYPNFAIVKEEIIVASSYILSGGVYKRTFISSKFLKKFHEFEMKNNLWKKVFGTQLILVLQKIN